jgi:hypothetical protein
VGPQPNIPWSLVRQDGNDPDAYKEQVFKALQKQMIDEAHDDEVLDDLANQREIKVPFDTGDLLKMAAFGGTIGSITGAVFGFMDGMRTAGESAVLQKASGAAKARYLMEGTTRSGTVFGVFFGGFHVVRASDCLQIHRERFRSNHSLVLGKVWFARGGESW